MSRSPDDGSSHTAHQPRAAKKTAYTDGDISEPTRLWIKHEEGSTPSRELIAEALARAGDYRVIDG